MTTSRRATSAGIGTLVALGLLVAPATASTPRTYHQSDSGKTVNLRVGSTLKVDLVAASGTPCSYKVTAGRHSTRFTIVSRRTHAAPHQPGVVGYPYHTVWTLKGRKAGTDTFKVALVCNTKVAQRFKLTIDVKKA